MKLICEEPSDFFILKMAAEASTKYGFIAIYVNDIGQCAIVPPDKVYALSKKQNQQIHKKIKSLRKLVKK